MSSYIFSIFQLQNIPYNLEPTSHYILAFISTPSSLLKIPSKKEGNTHATPCRYNLPTTLCQVGQQSYLSRSLVQVWHWPAWIGELLPKIYGSKSSTITYAQPSWIRLAGSKGNWEHLCFKPTCITPHKPRVLTKNPYRDFLHTEKVTLRLYWVIKDHVGMLSWNTRW